MDEVALESERGGGNCGVVYFGGLMRTPIQGGRQSVRDRREPDRLQELLILFLSTIFKVTHVGNMHGLYWFYIFFLSFF